ncbi:TIR domain-containing protein [Pedobacter mendelii]|uniref:CD-NTase-associated protein 12/Pycsar effector protein TIR domain-containing protein n=1 Tax=Pedobacter mendelii TaxID=1908240 RepID=A0ABQ2BGZ8_9SPHI|nr:nucleotide-binding protein [Pedobacter mendelii]GGI23647.1 hypothetical protein GCM10008119_08690 [Pedobacter mendelii]
MNNSSITFAKLAGLDKKVSLTLSRRNLSYDSDIVIEYYNLYIFLRAKLIKEIPELYSELPVRKIPTAQYTLNDGQRRGYIESSYLRTIKEDLSYIFEVRSNSRIGETTIDKPNRIFISHGKSTEWYKLQAYLEKTLNYKTLELAQEANQGRTIMQKLGEESDKCRYAIIVMTGDDEQGEDKPRARENVMHEIGFFQGKYGFRNVCLLYEENTSLPSNIHGLVYIPFTRGMIEATFGALSRELSPIFNKQNGEI